MPANNSQNHSTVERLARRRRSSLLTSDPVADKLPIDFILVFTDVGTQSAFEFYREKFENYLTNKQNLTLERVVSINYKKF